MLGVGEVKAVFDFFAVGADFGVADVDAMREQDAAYQREQAVPVFAGEFEGGVVTFRLDVDAGVGGEVFEAFARQAAGERRWWLFVGDVLFEFVGEFGPRAAGFRSGCILAG